MSYTISNPGTGSLSLTGTPLVDVAGITNISSVNVSINPSATVAASGFTTFTVSYTVAAAGGFEFALSISNNAASKDPYYWGVTGNGVVPLPVIELRRGSTVLGASDSIGAAKPGTPKVLTYTVQNTGTASLSISGVTWSGEVNCSVALTIAPAGAVAPGAFTTFTLEITPVAEGPFSVDVAIANNDATQNPRTLSINGNGQTPDSSSGGGCTTGEVNRIPWWPLWALLALATCAVTRRKLLH